MIELRVIDIVASVVALTTYFAIVAGLTFIIWSLLNR